MPRTVTILPSLAGWALAAAVSLTPAAAADWPMFGRTLDNAADGGSEYLLLPSRVGKLKPKWTVTTGGDVSARAAVVDRVAYFPDWGGNVWAVETGSGRVLWHHTLEEYGFPKGTISRTSPAVADDTVYLGTLKEATLVALDARTGKLRWRRQLDAHPQAFLTLSPAVSGHVLYTGVSSGEESAAADPSYKCCSFRGSAVAVDARTGKVLWQAYMAPEGYSGTAIWGSNPVVDEQRRTVFYGTGNNYAKPSAPAYLKCIAKGGTEQSCHSPDDHFDSIVALSTESGRVKWSRRLSSADDWNVACIGAAAVAANCPSPAGGDFDFASAPNEFTVSMPYGGRRTVLGAGQKSGLYAAFDPDSGRMLWATQVGPGASLGGIEWGSATDGRRIYVAISNSDHKSYAAGTAGSWNALDPATGRILWRTPDPNGAIDLGPLTVANGVVYAPSMATGPKQATMFGLDAATGKVLWRFAPGSSVNAGATVADGAVFWGSGYTNLGALGTGNNKFFAFSLDGR